jgi:hypothetical protein
MKPNYEKYLPPTMDSEETHEWKELMPEPAGHCSNLSLPMVNKSLIAGNPNLDVKIDDPYGAKSSMADKKKPLTDM